MSKSRHPAPALDTESLERSIHIVRGVKVMLDAGLAALYGVPTKRLNEAVRRNRRRFPADFLLELTPQEVSNLRSQIATSSSGAEHGGRLRRALVGHAELARKIEELEQRYDGQFQIVFDTLRELMSPDDPDRARIGFDQAT